MLGVALAALSVGCGSSGDPGRPVASVSGEPISHGALEHWTESFRAKKGVDARFSPEREALSFLINAKWIRREAEHLGLSVSHAELSERIKEDAENFGGESGLRELRSRVGLTPADYRLRLRLDVLGRKLQDALVETASVTASEVENYYHENPRRFVRPPARDLRVAVAKKKREADAAAAELRQEAGWASVVARHDGLQTAPGARSMRIDASNVLPGLWEAVSGVPLGETGGPIRVRGNYWVFEVVAVRPPDKQSLEEARPQIVTVLKTNRENDQFRRFVGMLRGKYKERTACLAEYEVPECGTIVDSSDGL